MPYSSEMNFYKIDDENYVFSVRASMNGAIRYYSMRIDEESNCVVKRIKNALAFVTKHNLPKILEFTPDYVKVITSLIDYCDYDAKTVDYTGTRKRAIDYSKLPRCKRINGETMINPPRASKKRDMGEDSSFYEVDSEDRVFISDGIRTNNYVNSFRLK